MPLAVAAALLAVAGAGFAADVVVDVRNTGVSIPSLTVAPGTNVTWRTLQGSHWLMHENSTRSVPWEHAQPNWCEEGNGTANCKRSFPTPGTFVYYCFRHPDVVRGEVRVMHPTAPDLRVAAIVFEDPGVTTRMVVVTVENAGVNASAPNHVQVTWTGASNQAGTVGGRTVPSLPGGGAWTAYIPWSSLKIGTFTVRAVVDPGDVVEELDESNNVRTATTVFVRAGSGYSVYP